MPLATRVIPTLLVRGRQLVKGKAFDSWRSVGHAAQAVRINQQRGCDELVLLDIGATPEGRGPDLKLIEELAEVLFCPLAVGGGVRTVEDVRALLRAGADKVVIRSEATPYDDFNFVRECAHTVGCQAIVVAVDYKADEVFTGNDVAHPFSPEQWCKAVFVAGAGEILLTSIEREGAMHGYDLDLIREVSSAVSIPVIAHGGCGSYRDMLLAVQAGASAVAAGSFFLFTEGTPAGAAKYLAEHGVETRDPNPAISKEHSSI